MIAAAEGDVEAEFLIQQDFARLLDSEVPEHAETDLSDVGVGGLIRDFFSLPIREWSIT